MDIKDKNLNESASYARAPKTIESREAVRTAVTAWLEFYRTQALTEAARGEADHALRTALLKEGVLVTADMPLGVNVLPPVEGDTAARFVLTGLGGDIVMDVTDNGGVNIYT